VRYLLAIVALGVLVALHELGHLIAARFFGVGVVRYSIGFGPPIFTLRRGGTAYTLGWVPFGGFVQIQGTNPHEEGLDPKDPRSFANQRPWKRILVLAAGSVLNYVLAIVLLAGLYLSGTHVPVPMTIGTIDPGSEAARAQLRAGDRVLAVEGVELKNWSDLVDVVNDNADQSLAFDIWREGAKQRIAVRPQSDQGGVGHIGVTQQYTYREFGPLEAVGQAFAHANTLFVEGVRMISRLARGRRGVELSTPVGIVLQASEAASAGLGTFVRMLAAISVALAVFNLLPIPALDGGRVVFAAIEGLTRRRVSPELETVLHSVGFIALLALLVLVAVRDVRKWLGPHSAPPAAPTKVPSPPTAGRRRTLLFSRSARLP
jgi:regulator of sigma E protease